LPEEHKAGSMAITGTHSDYNLKRNAEEASNVRNKRTRTTNAKNASSTKSVSFAMRVCTTLLNLHTA
jgi:hypothetical protein